MMIVVSGAASLVPVNELVAELRERRMPAVAGGLIEDRLKSLTATWMRRPATDENPGYHDDQATYVVLMAAQEQLDAAVADDPQDVMMALMLQISLVLGAARIASEIFALEKREARVYVVSAKHSVKTLVDALRGPAYGMERVLYHQLPTGLVSASFGVGKACDGGTEG